MLPILHAFLFTFLLESDARHRHLLKNAAHTNTPSIVLCRWNYLFCMLSFENINTWKYGCSSNGLGRDITDLMPNFFIYTTSTAFSQSSLRSRIWHTGFCLTVLYGTWNVFARPCGNTVLFQPPLKSLRIIASSTSTSIRSVLFRESTRSTVSCLSKVHLCLSRPEIRYLKASPLLYTAPQTPTTKLFSGSGRECASS